ncbi:hypothetical protein SBRCBS47491_005418 [Sporothrix bragantina]|uniref:Heterokaryon incompatibility domain-containing protein n=1 Tax=Sporothrix bragantina TaxID=671064 RepID=A0ABP0BXC7_9PEZI
MTYRYAPVDESRHKIRLLTLLPSKPNELLRGTIASYSLADNVPPPPYKALSYCWGDPSSVASIFVDSCPLPIAHDLNVVLRHLRFLQEKRVLWIDAICINHLHQPAGCV